MNNESFAHSWNLKYSRHSTRWTLTFPRKQSARHRRQTVAFAVSPVARGIPIAHAPGAIFHTRPSQCSPREAVVVASAIIHKSCCSSPTLNHQHQRPAELRGDSDELGLERTRYAVVLLFARNSARSKHDVLPVRVLPNVSSGPDHTLVNSTTCEEGKLRAVERSRW